MGCCQSNLSSPPKPIPKHLFVDKIKQSQSSGLMSLGQESKLIKKGSQSQQSYQYSVHDIKNEQQKESSVSILNQQKKNLFKRTNHKQNLHVEIHPEVIQNQELRQKLFHQKINHITTQNQNHSKDNYVEEKSERKECDNEESNVTLEYFQWEDEARLSRIDVLRQITNIDKTQSYQCQQYLTGQDKISSQSQNLLILKSNRQLQSIKQLQTIKQNTQQGNELLWRQNSSSYNQTDRELLQLHGELQTMIVRWEKSIGKTKRLKLQQMNKERYKVTKEDDNQVGSKVLKVDKYEKNEDKVNNDEDEQLMEIWNQNNKQQQKQIQPKQQHQSENMYQQLKKDYILKSPSLPKQQDLKLDLNKVKDQKQQNNFKPNEKPNQKEQQHEESVEDDEQYSKCLLTNPTRILDLSLDQHWVWEKQAFYQTAKNLQKWTEQHRKALPIQDQHINFFMDKLTNVQVSSQLLPDKIKMLCCLMSIIKGYFQLDKVNLIAYKYQTPSDAIDRKTQIAGFRIFYNGLKRLFPFYQKLSQEDYTQTQQDQCVIQNLFKIYLSLSTPNNKKNPAQLVYNLTGWIPEYIVIEEISSFDGVFERINSNFIEGNTIVTFTSTQNQCYGLKSIDIKLKLIHVYDFNSCSVNSQNQSFITTFKWQQFVSTISSINVNWNPLIYDFIFKTQNLFLSPSELRSYDIIQELDQTSLAISSRQYRLKIPPSQQDIELRVFLQVHYTDQFSASQQKEGPLTMDLYDYSGTRVHSTIDPIRTINKKHYVYSDVLIFEASKQKSEYVLLVRLNFTNQNQSKHPDCPLKYTLSTYSFVQVALSQIPLQCIIQQKSITTYLQQSHCGHGINSPHFLDNFYLQLKIPPLQKLKIFVKMPTNQSQFELNLIANPEKEPNLTRLNLENILGDIITSEQFDNGKGYLQIQTKHEEYFLMITNHTKCKGEFQIVVQIVQDMAKTLNPQNLKGLYQPQSNDHNSKQQLIFYKQKFFYQEPSLTRQVKWIPTHTGPRKRLKSNTHSGYQPFTNFKQFFKNPYVDYSVSSTKKLQFSIHSQTYRKLFDELQETEQKRDAQPPTLSMSILKMKSPKDSSQKNITNQTLFKIVLDDAFYVPFGFGFWTKVLQIQQGQYRIVFPKMQKQSSIGVLNIYQIQA